jgi:hypothetical protein
MLFAVMLLCIESTEAQGPVLTAENSGLHIGDVFTFTYCKANNIDTSTSGVNQVWDYSGLTDSLYIDGIPVEDQQQCSVIYFAAGYFPPGATIELTHTDPIVYDFYSNDSASYYWGNFVFGMGLDATDFYIKPAPLTPLYPVSYGKTYFDSVVHINHDYDFNDSATYRGIDSLYADGYGTLMLPDRTIENVLRIKLISNHTGQRIEQFTYYAPGTHASLLSIQLTPNGTVVYYLSSETLPIQIVSFQASVTGPDAALTWQTADETNTNYFNIQRSKDGREFNTINRVMAAGNSNRIRNYSYVDPGITKLDLNKLYYRLQEVDKDGKTNYSGIQVIDFAKNKSIFNISPNPAKDHIIITSLATVGDAEITVTNANGRTLYATKRSFANGDQFNVPLSSFANETLFITITTTSGKKAFKVVKE